MIFRFGLIFFRFHQLSFVHSMIESFSQISLYFESKFFPFILQLKNSNFSSSLLNCNHTKHLFLHLGWKEVHNLFFKVFFQFYFLFSFLKLFIISIQLMHPIFFLFIFYPKLDLFYKLSFSSNHQVNLLQIWVQAKAMELNLFQD